MSIAIAVCRGWLFELSRAVLLPSSDHAVPHVSNCWPCNHSTHKAQQDDGPDEQAPLDTSGARKVGEGHLVTSAGTWGCDSAAKGEGIVRRGFAARGLHGHRVHAFWRGTVLAFVRELSTL